MSDSSKFEATQLRQLTDRLDAIIRLLARTLPASVSQKEKIRILSELGFQPKEIAAMLGTTPNTVSQELADFRRKAKQNAVDDKAVSKIGEQRHQENSPGGTNETSQTKQANAAEEVPNG